MPAILIRQRVSDFERWRNAFADQAHTYVANGCQSIRILRDSIEPAETFVILEWDSLVRARLFLRSDDMLESLDRRDASDPPDIWLLEDAAGS